MSDVLATWQIAFARELAKWRHTPYMEGCCFPGRRGGADCRYFVVGVHDALHRIHRPLPRRFEPRSYDHCHKTALAAMRETIDRYPCFRVIDGSIETGDVVIAKRAHDVGTVDEGTPQHLLLGGLKAGELWHCIRHNGVCQTSVGFYEIKTAHVYRSLEREQWK